MNPAFRERLQAAGLDVDAVSVLAKVGRRPEVPGELADRWAELWVGPPLEELLRSSPGDRQHLLAARVNDFLEHPAHQLQRATYAARSADPDLRACGGLALELGDALTAFMRDVTAPATSPFTGKVKYFITTDIDVATAAAIVEVTTQPDAAGKVRQMGVLLQPLTNPLGLPVFHFTPNIAPGSGPARALLEAGSAGVYNDRPALVAALRALPAGRS